MNSAVNNKDFPPLPEAANANINHHRPGPSASPDWTKLTFQVSPMGTIGMMSPNGTDFFSTLDIFSNDEFPPLQATKNMVRNQNDVPNTSSRKKSVKTPDIAVQEVGQDMIRAVDQNTTVDIDHHEQGNINIPILAHEMNKTGEQAAAVAHEQTQITNLMSTHNDDTTNVEFKPSNTDFFDQIDLKDLLETYEFSPLMNISKIEIDQLLYSPPPLAPPSTSAPTPVAAAGLPQPPQKRPLQQPEHQIKKQRYKIFTILSKKKSKIYIYNSKQKKTKPTHNIFKGYNLMKNGTLNLYFFPKKKLFLLYSA